MSFRSIKSQKQFRDVWLTGEKCHGRLMVLSVIKPNSDIESIFGISVGKNLGNAVKRNRIKRRIRNILIEIETTKEFTGLSLVVYLRKDAVNVSFRHLREELTYLLNEFLMNEGKT